MRSVILFNLRPREVGMLTDMSRGNRSYVVRGWLENHLKKPEPLIAENDNVLKMAVSMDNTLSDKVKAAAAANNMSTMQFVRLIVEKNLRDK